jgi:hypothetical protein
MSIKKSHLEFGGEHNAHHLSPSTHYLSPILQTMRHKPMKVGGLAGYPQVSRQNLSPLVKYTFVSHPNRTRISSSNTECLTQGAHFVSPVAH